MLSVFLSIEQSGLNLLRKPTLNMIYFLDKYLSEKHTHFKRKANLYAFVFDF